MPKITAQYTKTYGNYFDDISVIPDTGVSVQVEYYTGDAWVTDSQSPIIEAGTVFVRNSTVRLTPTGGSAWIGDGQGE